MNAGPQSIVSLLTSANQRMVIPVYQRAYSWDEEQCRQLWDDIVAVGRRSSGTHFTGSVVMVLGGEFSAAGVNKLLIIDGQQRITTLSLLIAAMAEFAREQPEKLTHVSYEEIIDSGYLVLKYKKGGGPLPSHPLARRRKDALLRCRPPGEPGCRGRE